ncbi:MAG: anaerobic carbon-monoxide dehydrogenase catalytic subunit [Dehalococcoidia bacterium]|nr:anaerobic carbon-monoxide dehydrogenase catalytic subunit [Dehalococcoidia bacterium]MDZ4247153.1 anaerobic carbon-monoxide dehydrogenase catalytic subunit [Dehalococcoidia bacterium]
MERKLSIDPTVAEMLEVARNDGISTPFDRGKAVKPCPIGQEGNCCRQCFMGPCRFVGKVEVGVCGATRETIQARNLTRMIAAGTAAHGDHGRNLAFSLKAVAEGKAPGFQIKDVKKLHKVAGYLGVDTRNKTTEEIALQIAKITLGEYGKQEGELLYVKRAPPKRQEVWKNLGITPRNIDREVAETMHRTHMGTDQDAEHLLNQALRCALADGWGGSMLATDISDILFGTPVPISATSNFGALKEDEVNVVIHGHEPTLAEMIAIEASNPEVVEYARSKGAKGINVVGMCCSGNELLLRHGVPIIGNFLQQELAIASGAVEAMVVDYQCIMQGIVAAAEKKHTRVITTSPVAKITGATHIEFDEHRGPEIARLILRTAADAFPKRKETHIPDYTDRLVVGFSHEYIAYMQGGVYRESFRPLNDAIMQGRIRGAVGIVGCNNVHTTHDEDHISLTKEFIKNDVLVVTTGCGAGACAKHGLLTPEVMRYAGPGLAEVCETIGIPPVLHVGSCIDNSRILTILSQCAMEGGLGEDISDLPVVGIAAEWMAEKALAIGTYFVASGVYTIFGTVSPIEGSPVIEEMVSKGWEDKVGGKLEFETDWRKILEKSLAHIDLKRRNLKLEEYNPAKYARSASYIPGDAYSNEEFKAGLYSRGGLK